MTLLPGFVATAPPRSVIEAVSRVSHDRLKMIAKASIERYLRQFLDSTGAYHGLIGAVAKGSLTYVTDKSVDATHDVTLRTTQLVRLFNEVREKLPSIVIIDAGMQSVPSGLNSGLTHAMIVDNKWQGWFCKFFKIPLTIAVLTGDQDSTDQLVEVIELTFNNLRQTVGGSELRGDGLEDHWVVRLPLEFNISSTAGQNITEDQKDQLWLATFDLTVDAEDTFAIEVPFDFDMAHDYSLDSALNAQPGSSSVSAALPPIIDVATTMQVGQQYSVAFRRLRQTHRIAIDQPMVATIDVPNRTITPRRPGTFNLQVLDLAVRQNDAPRAMAPTVAAQTTITVTL